MDAPSASASPPPAYTSSPNTGSVSGADAYAGASADHGGGSGGLPQLEMQHWAGQIVWLLLIFIVLYGLLSRVFLPRLRAIRDEREGTISRAVEAARLVQAEAADQATVAQAEVNRTRAEVRASAVAARARVTEAANARQLGEEAVVNARIAEAEAAIGRTRDAAMANVSAIATDTARAIVERLTGTTVSAAEAAAAVKGAA